MERLALPQPTCSKPLDMRIWKGKRLFVDMDGTLINSRKIEDLQGYLKSRNFLRPLIDIGTDSPEWYEIERVNIQAAAGLDALRTHGAMPLITSLGGVRYVTIALERACIGRAFYGVYGSEDMLDPTDGGAAWYPKNFDNVIGAIGERDPHRNCVVIGNEPHWDVPMSPIGIVSVLTTMDFDFNEISDMLTRMLMIGGGDFAIGFDRMVPKGRYGRIEMASKDDWEYHVGLRGKARIVYCDREAVERASSRSAGTQPIYL